MRRQRVGIIGNVEMFGERNYWRETQRPVRFLCFDVRIVGFIGLALVHFRIWTLILLLVATIAFLWMEWKGINPANIFTHLRTLLTGPYTPARRMSELRRPIDFGFETFGLSRPHVNEESDDSRKIY